MKKIEAQVKSILSAENQAVYDELGEQNIFGMVSVIFQGRNK